MDNNKDTYTPSFKETFEHLKTGFDNLSKEREVINSAVAEKLFSNDTLDIINWKTLSSLEYNKWHVLEGRGVRFKRIKHPTKECFYRTELDPKKSNKNCAYFGYQTHDCKEVGKVISGSLVELVENSKKYEAGDYFIYPANFSHKPKSWEKSVYEVEFINPQKK